MAVAVNRNSAGPQAPPVVLLMLRKTRLFASCQQPTEVELINKRSEVEAFFTLLLKDTDNTKS